MYKSTLLFALGLFSGAMSTYVMLISIYPAVDISPPLRQLTKAINSLESRTIELEIAMQALPSPTTMHTRAPTQPQAEATPTRAMQDPQGSDVDFGQTVQQLSDGRNMTTSAPIPEPEPSAEQTETYHSIDMQLSGASNDYSADLSGLIKQAEGLTESQRSMLTQKATQMIKNGELKADQFNIPAKM